jgi:hypothetical protein
MGLRIRGDQGRYEMTLKIAGRVVGGLHLGGFVINVQQLARGRMFRLERIELLAQRLYPILTKNIVVSSPQFVGAAQKRKNSVMAQEIELKFIVAQPRMRSPMS